MTVTTNSVFLAVRRDAVLPETGWEVKVRSAPLGPVLAEVSDFRSLTISVALGGVDGNDGGTITLDLDSPFWSTTLADGRPATRLLDRDYLWECYEDGVKRGQFLGTNVEDTVVAEDGTRTTTVSGPGPAAVLGWAKVFPPGYPYVGLKWPFTFSTPAMEIFLHLLRAAQARGTIPWVKPMFTRTRDSAGVRWPDVVHRFTRAETFTPEQNSTLLDQLAIATGSEPDTPAGLRADWVMWPDFKLDVRPVIGVHREDRVVFYEPTVSAEQRIRSREEIRNVVVVCDHYGQTSRVADAASIAAWYRREEIQQHDAVTDPAKRTQVARAVADTLAAERSTWTISVPYRDEGRRPFVDYGLGDWVGVSRHQPDRANTVEAVRVMGITVNVDENSQPSVELTLQSLWEFRQRELTRRLTQVINKVSNSPGIRIPPIPNLPPEPDVPRIPKDTPEGPVMTDFPGLGGTGTGDCHVWIQASDPGTAAKVGDFWYQP